jgi:hypothetical protein
LGTSLSAAAGAQKNGAAAASDYQSISFSHNAGALSTAPAAAPPKCHEKTIGGNPSQFFK